MQKFLRTFVVGGWTTHLKNMLVKLDHETPKIGVEISKNLKNHHLALVIMVSKSPNWGCSTSKWPKYA